MRKLAISMALATTVLATPALARDGAWYVGIEGGAQRIQDYNYDLGAVNEAFKVHHEKVGYDVDAIVGYDFGMFRVEAEGGYKNSNLDYVRTFRAGFPNSAPVGVARRYDAADGNTTSISGMLNGLVDFGKDDGIQFSVGGGVGVARVKADGYTTVKFGPTYFIDDSDTRFAWQALAQVRAPITQNIDVGLKYRFYNVDNVRVTAGNGAPAEFRVRSHSVLASLIYNFGEKAPPPPPPPVAAAPGPFIVFFDWNKSAITPEAASILDNAAAAYQQGGSASVVLAGHADKSGSDQYNVGLSQRRADAVKTYLAGKGIPESATSTEAFGESRPLVETADGVREPQNRRVEITFGPGSGQ